MASIEALSGELIILRAEGQRLQDQLENAEATANENNIRITEAAIAQNRAARDQVVQQINDVRNGGTSNGTPYSPDDADIVITITDLEDLPPGQTGGTGSTVVDEPVPIVPGNVITIVDEDDPIIPGAGGPGGGDGDGDGAEGTGFFEGIGDAIGYGLDTIGSIFDSEPDPVPEPQKEGQVVTFVEEEDDPLPRPQREPLVLDVQIPDPEVEPEFETPAQEEAIVNSTLDAARQKAAVREQFNTPSNDWRVKLCLAPQANYLYQEPGITPQSSVLWPLAETGGVVFPYTPRIETQYRAEYRPYDPTHSNHRYYFYKGSKIESVLVTGTFTAQDTKEANYLLAVLTFFKSASRMFYGQDALRGAPPPVLFFKGFGQYQFANNPCVLAQFNMQLPDDVDYIRADTSQITSTGLLQQQRRQARTQAPALTWASVWARLQGSGLQSGAPSNVYQVGIQDLTEGKSPTYVPTKMTITIELYPMQSRQQISNEFSVKDYANGTLLRRGYW